MKLISFITLLALIASSAWADDYPVFTYTLNDAIVEAKATQKDVLLIFTADWCKYCRIMKKDIDANPDSLEGLVVSYIDVDKYPDLVKKYKVKRLPECIIISNTKEIKRKSGYKDIDSLKKWLNNGK